MREEERRMEKEESRRELERKKEVVEDEIAKEKKLQRVKNAKMSSQCLCLFFQVEALESVTTRKLKQWDRDRVHQLKQKEEEEEKKAWDNMFQIQVKAILCEQSQFDQTL